MEAVSSSKMLASFYPPHGVTSQKTAFFIVTTVRTENLMSAVMTNVTFVIFTLSFVAFGLQEVQSQKTAFFIVTTVRTENLMSAVMTNVTFVIFTLSFVAFGLQEVQYGGHHPCTPTHKGCQMNW